MSSRSDAPRPDWAPPPATLATPRLRRRQSGLARFWLALLGTVLVLTGAVLALPHDPYIRYQSLNDTIYNRAQWIYERIHHDPEPIDVVFIGSSRTGAAVQPELLEAALAERGLDLGVANFSLASSGMDIRDTLLRETFRAKSPKLVVIPVVEAFPRDGHDAWGEIATAGEVLTAPVIVNRNLPGNLLRLPVRQLSLATASLVPEAWGREAGADPEGYAARSAKHWAVSYDDPAEFATHEHLATLEEQAKRRYRSIRPPILPERFSWVEFGVSQSYIRDMVALARENGAEVAFLFLPFYTGYEGPVEEAWLSEYGPLWKANFTREDPTNYRDSGHLNGTERVREAITAWLADRIAETLPTSSE